VNDVATAYVRWGQLIRDSGVQVTQN